MQVRNAWCWRSRKIQQHRQGLSEHELQNTAFPGQHLEFRKTQREQNEMSENQECGSDGSQKSIWKQFCQRKTAVGCSLARKREAGGLAPSPAPALVTKAAAVGERSSGTVKVCLRLWRDPGHLERVWGWGGDSILRRRLVR